MMKTLTSSLSCHICTERGLRLGSDASVKSTQKCKPKCAQYMDKAHIYGNVSLCCLSLHGNCMYSVEDGQEISKGLARPVLFFPITAQQSYTWQRIPGMKALKTLSKWIQATSFSVKVRKLCTRVHTTEDTQTNHDLQLVIARRRNIYTL